MTTTHTNISLFEGEIRIYDEKTKGLLASTHDYKSDLVGKLDRKHFVKPKVDVEELAEEKADEKYYPKSEIKPHFINGFKAGYNAKEAEFTMEEFRQGLTAMRNHKHMSIDDVINTISPLSLPASITTDENYNVISVQWG